MGEKGMAAGALPAEQIVGTVAGETTSIIERAGTVVTTSITDVGSDVASTLRDRAAEAAADHALAEGRERLHRRATDPSEEPPDAATPPPAPG